jgi:multiple sugar transport system permease protein
VIGAGRARVDGRRLRRVGAPYAYVVPALLFLVALELYPIAYNLRNSLTDLNVGTFLSGRAEWVGLDNYAKVIDDPAFRHSVGVSIAFTLACIVLQFTLGLALALYFQRPFPGATVLRALLVLGWLLPGVVTGNLFRWLFEGDSGVVPWLVATAGLGEHAWLTDPDAALWAAVATNVWVGIPFNMILLLPALQAIPGGLYEAAEIDGASAWQRFRHITLPLLRPAALSVILLGVIYTFKVFDLVYVLTGGGPGTSTTLFSWYAYTATFKFLNLGQGAALSFLMTAVLLLAIVVYMRVVRLREEVV